MVERQDAAGGEAGARSLCATRVEVAEPVREQLHAVGPKPDLVDQHVVVRRPVGALRACNVITPT